MWAPFFENWVTPYNDLQYRLSRSFSSQNHHKNFNFEHKVVQRKWYIFFSTFLHENQKHSKNLIESMYCTKQPPFLVHEPHLNLWVAEWVKGRQQIALNEVVKLTFYYR